MQWKKGCSPFDSFDPSFLVLGRIDVDTSSCRIHSRIQHFWAARILGPELRISPRGSDDLGHDITSRSALGGKGQRDFIFFLSSLKPRLAVRRGVLGEESW